MLMEFGGMRDISIFFVIILLCVALGEKCIKTTYVMEASSMMVKIELLQIFQESSDTARLFKFR